MSADSAKVLITVRERPAAPNHNGCPDHCMVKLITVCCHFTKTMMASARHVCWLNTSYDGNVTGKQHKHAVYLPVRLEAVQSKDKFLACAFDEERKAHCSVKSVYPSEESVVAYCNSIALSASSVIIAHNSTIMNHPYLTHHIQIQLYNCVAYRMNLAIACVAHSK
eukprot:scaffold65386_cov18-Prasinocladus_malaysianus.AAC.1